MRCLDLHTQQEPLFLKEDISHCHSHLMQFTGINIIIITTVVIHTSWSAKLTSHAKYYSACENSWIQSPVGFLFLFNLSLLKYVHLCISWKGGGVVQSKYPDVLILIFSLMSPLTLCNCNDESLEFTFEDFIYHRASQLVLNTLSYLL